MGNIKTKECKEFDLIRFDQSASAMDGLAAIQEVMKDILRARNVRMGWAGQMPVFSVMQALNAVEGKGKSDPYGSNFFHGQFKRTHPELFGKAIYCKMGTYMTPCMSFGNVLMTLAKANASFSDHLHRVAVAGMVMAEAGDEGLIRYVLSNASLDTEYHDLMRRILWAEENPERALQGDGPVGENDAGAGQVSVVIMC